MGKPEREAIHDWLVGEGYPLEYETARELARVGFNVSQGSYYLDEDGGAQREVDVLAHEPSSKANPWRPVMVAVECKNNKNPWLVLTTKQARGPRNSVELLVGGHEVASQGLPPTIDDAAFILGVPERYGYSLVRAFIQEQGKGGGRNVDEAYAALQGVTKAAVGSLAQTKFGVALPLIVLAGSLYRLGFEDDGSEILEPVLWSPMIWHGSRVIHRGLLVHVVTRAHLAIYAHSLRIATKAIAETIAGA